MNMPVFDGEWYILCDLRRFGFIDIMITWIMSMKNAVSPSGCVIQGLSDLL